MVINEDVLQRVAGLCVATKPTLSMVPEMSYNDIATHLVGKPRRWNGRSTLRNGELQPRFRSPHLIVCSCVLPCRDPSLVIVEWSVFIVRGSKGATFDLVAFIHHQIRNVALPDRVHRDLGWVGLLHKIFVAQGVEVDVSDKMVKVSSTIGHESSNKEVDADITDTKQGTAHGTHRRRSGVGGSHTNVGKDVHHTVAAVITMHHELKKKVTKLQDFFNN